MSELLTAYKDETLGCTRCPLASTRTQVVFGSGDSNAELMFVGEAPGYHEDQQGVPFVGQAGQLLEKLLNGIGLTRADVYIANVLKCRPPGNRDPQPEEIEACESHLFRQIELIRPTLVATLGNFATKLLSGKPTGITRVHGDPAAGDARRQRRDALPALPPGRRALHALDARSARSRTSCGSRSCSGGLPFRRPKARPCWRRNRSRTWSACTSRPSSSGSSSPRRGAALLLARRDRGDRRTARGRLVPGDVVTVSGELGAGKTTFVRGACRALGVTAPVTSPTYTIGHRYEGDPDVSHLDLYRFTGVSAAEWADLEPYFDDAVVFVEWPEAGAAGLPAVRAAVRLEHDSPTSRVLRIEAAPELLARVAT